MFLIKQNLTHTLWCVATDVCGILGVVYSVSYLVEHKRYWSFLILVSRLFDGNSTEANSGRIWSRQLKKKSYLNNENFYLDFVEGIRNPSANAETGTPNHLVFETRPVWYHIGSSFPIRRDFSRVSLLVEMELLVKFVMGSWECQEYGTAYNHFWILS